MRWILPLVLLGLVGCASKSYSGQWEGRTDDARVLLEVYPDGQWAAQTLSHTGDSHEVSGTWVMEGTDKARFISRDDTEQAEAILAGENRLVLRAPSGETHFQRR